MREALLALVVYLVSAAGVVEARPPLGSGCRTCHSNAVTGMMAVAGEDKTLDLGEQLDGSVRGPLKTFVARPADMARLSVEVLDPPEAYGLQLKRLEKPGQQNSADNFLVWVEVGSGTDWYMYGETDPYSATAIIENSTAGVFTFDLIIDAGTPLDVYELTFAMAGGFPDMLYQEEHFYLEVALLKPGDANRDGLVDDDDLSLLLGNWGRDTDWDHGEFSGLWPVNDDDLSLLLANWTGSTASVPEPATLGLLGLGGLGLLRLRTSRRNEGKDL